MTSRSGGGPRDSRSHARPYDEDAYATEPMSDYPEPSRRDRGARDHGRDSHGLFGLLKFLAFALIMGAIILFVSLTALRPVFNGTVLSWAAENPGALKLPFVKDLVREDLEAALVTPASSDASQVEFIVEPGDTASTIAARLAKEGLVSDARAFVFNAIDRELTGDLQQGTFVLRRNMTPGQLVTALLAAPEVKYVDVGLRTGLRLEQITAKLESLPLEMDTSEFYDLARSPTPALLADYPWLTKILKDAPKGASLEGFLWPATYRVLPDTTPEELLRMMLDGFAANVGEERVVVPKERGKTFYEILVMASIVEREAQLDEEKPLIAGVYQNRLDPKKWPRLQLESDPTIFYVHDSLSLAKMPLAEWPGYIFWAPIKGGLTGEELPPTLVAYNTYTSAGLPPGPIATPTLASIDAALEPDTGDGFLYFLAKGDGSKTTAFAKTFKEHEANIKKYLKP